MKNSLRRWAIAGFGVALAVALGTSAMAAADTPPTDTDSAPSAVEDFAYPGSSPYPALKLIRGDGHMVRADCHTVTQIQLWSRMLPRDVGQQVCFKVTGPVGYLALELPETTIIQTADRPVQASLTTDGVTTTIGVPKDTMQNVGEALGLKPTTLVELRVNG